MNPVALTLLAEQLQGIAQEMGSALARSAFSPNIRVRLDFSCALFSPRGELLAQAAHIPVHLGSMPAHVRRLLETRTLSPGELYLGNDPYDGGTHLPDLTLLRPVFHRGHLLGIAAVRAHHADVGGPVPGSMASQKEIYGEGLRLPLVRLAQQDRWDPDLQAILWANMRAPSDRQGDLLAQQAATHTGERGLQRLFDGWSQRRLEVWNEGLAQLLQATERRVRDELQSLFPIGQTGRFRDRLEAADQDLPIAATVHWDGERFQANFEGTSATVASSFNAPLPVTQAALAYVVSCLLPEAIPINEGLLRCLEVLAPESSLVRAAPPAAVAAGNVETSQRIVDVLLGALHPLLPQRIPAASAGTMNNLSFGFAKGAVHYETSGGGAGAHPEAPGASALQVHMTNTRATPVEILESEFPLRVEYHRLRAQSGGAGRHPGGDGTDKELTLLEPATLTLMATRRRTQPYGLDGGEPGQPGRQAIRLPEGDWIPQPGTFTTSLPAGSALRLETPGGGGHGPPATRPDAAGG